MSSNPVSREDLVAHVRRMRADGATYGEIKKALNIGASTVARLLGTAGTGSPRPRLSAQRREHARKLREDGWSVPEISRELGIAKSTAFQLTQGIAWELSPREVQRRRNMSRAYWDEQNALRDAARSDVHHAASAKVGELTGRDLLLIGAVLYWAEGAKSKPWRTGERLTFINSDPDVIEVYLAWLALLGVSRDRLKFRVHIHESADVQTAEQYWAEIVGVPVCGLEATLLKKHNTVTRRKNVGSEYRGCLIVQVGRSRKEYWHMNGLWKAIVARVRAR